MPADTFNYWRDGAPAVAKDPKPEGTLTYWDKGAPAITTVEGSVLKQSVYAFDQRGFVGKTTSLLFDQLTLVGRQTEYSLDILILAGKDGSYLFDQRVLLPQDISYLFDQRVFVSSDMVYVFSLAADTAVKASSYKFGIRSSIEKQAGYPFDLRMNVSMHSDYVFNILLLGLRTSYPFDLRNLVQKESAYLFDVSKLAARSSSYPFNLLQQVVRETSYPWHEFFGNQRWAVLRARTPAERHFLLRGVSGAELTRYFLLRGAEEKSAYRDFVLSGLPGADRDFAVLGGQNIEADFLLGGIEALRYARRLSLLEPLRLRTTSVYRQPREIVPLQIVFGDLSSSKIHCKAIDRDGYLHHASDLVMQSISKVYVDGAPVTAGYTAYPAYADETGKAVAAVVFDNPQYTRQVSVSGKGAIGSDTGVLIENPADVIRSVIIDVQGYDESSLDLGELSRFYADCLNEDISVAFVLSSAMTVKEFLDTLSYNIIAQWVMSDGRSLMRLKWL